MLGRRLNSNGLPIRMLARTSLIMALAVVASVPILVLVGSESEKFNRWRADVEHVGGSLEFGGGGSFGTGSVIFTEGGSDDFTQRIRSEKHWKKNRKGNKYSNKELKNAKHSSLLKTKSYGFFNLLGEDEKNSRRNKSRKARGTYRTVCVRTCDGYYWPVSFATSRSQFRADDKYCKSSCEAPARLFYYSNPSEEPPDMVDLKGRKYNQQSFAWRFQAKYDAQCKCGAHPWEEVSVTRHQMYAELEKTGKLKRYLAKLTRHARRTSGKRRREKNIGVARAGRVKLSSARLKKARGLTKANPTTRRAKKVRRKANAKPWKKDWKSMRLGAGNRKKSSRRKSVARRKSRDSWKSRAFNRN